VQSNMPEPDELELEVLVEELDAVVDACDDDDAVELDELAIEVDFVEPDAVDDAWLVLLPAPPEPASSPQPVAANAVHANTETAKETKQALFIATPPSFGRISYRAAAG
jgi:hypothetical protein